MRILFVYPSKVLIQILPESFDLKIVNNNGIFLSYKLPKIKKDQLFDLNFPIYHGINENSIITKISPDKIEIFRRTKKTKNAET